MKRILSALMVCVLLFCCGFASAEVDLSKLSETELRALIDAAYLEMVKYHPAASDGSILDEDEYIRVIFTGKMELDMFDSLNISVIVENLTDKNIIIGFNDAACNGWAIWEATASVPANKKAKADLSFMNAVVDAELSDVSEVKEISCTLHCFDSDTIDTLFDSAPQIWYFNN